MGLKIFIALIYSLYCIHVLPAYIFPHEENGTMAVTDRDGYNRRVMDGVVKVPVKQKATMTDNINYTFVVQNRPQGD